MGLGGKNCGSGLGERLEQILVVRYPRDRKAHPEIHYYVLITGCAKNAVRDQAASGLALKVEDKIKRLFRHVQEDLLCYNFARTICHAENCRLIFELYDEHVGFCFCVVAHSHGTARGLKILVLVAAQRFP